MPVPFSPVAQAECGERGALREARTSSTHLVTIGVASVIAVANNPNRTPMMRVRRCGREYDHNSAIPSRNGTAELPGVVS